MQISQDENRGIIFFNEYGDYEDMENLYNKFQRELNAVLHNKIDGPYSRVWIISIHDEQYKLVIDDACGSYIVADDKSAKEKLIFLLPLISQFLK